MEHVHLLRVMNVGSRALQLFRDFCPGFVFSSSGFVMIEGDFNSRTLVNMNIALERVCRNTPLGEQHDVRKRVAQGLLQCVRSGKTTLGALTEAGERALARIPERTSKSA
jgi:hypothetical protein